MGCDPSFSHAIYEVVRSKKEKATEGTRQKLQMTPVTLAVELLTWIWCTKNCDLIGCVYLIWSESVKYGRSYGADTAKISNDTCDLDLWPMIVKMVRDTWWHHGLCVYLIWSESVKIVQKYRADTPRNWNDPCDLDIWPFIMKMVRDTWWPHRSYVCHIWSASAKSRRSHGADTAKTSNNRCDIHLKFQGWPSPLTFWPGNRWRHIVMSWTIFVQSIKQVGQIGTEPRSGHDKTSKDPCDLDLLSFDLTSYVPQAFYKINVWCRFDDDWVKWTWLKRRYRRTERQTKPSIEYLPQLEIRCFTEIANVAFKYSNVRGDFNIMTNKHISSMGKSQDLEILLYIEICKSRTVYSPMSLVKRVDVMELISCYNSRKYMRYIQLFMPSSYIIRKNICQWMSSVGNKCT